MGLWFNGVQGWDPALGFCVITRWTAMNQRRKHLSVLIGGVSVVAIVAILLLQGGSDGDGDLERTLEASTPGVAKGGGATGAASADRHGAESAGVNEANGNALLPVKNRVLLLCGQVIERGTGDPVDSFSLFVRRKGSKPRTWETVLDEAVNDEEGRFSFPVAQTGAYNLCVRSSRHLHPGWRDVTIDEEHNPVKLDIHLDRGLSVEGQVVEDATGAPVAGAVVGLQFALQTDSLVLGRTFAGSYSTTDEQGQFVLMGLKKNQRDLVALHPGFAEGVAPSVQPGSGDPVEVRLKTGFFISGRALDDRGEPIEGLLIQVYGPPTPVPRSFLTAADGSYRTAPVAPGSAHVFATPPPGRSCVGARPAFTAERKSVTIADHDLQVDFGPSPEHVTWSGAVFDMLGEPVAEGQLSVLYSNDNQRMSWDFQSARSVTLDNAGRFTIGKLLPGVGYRARVRFPDQAMPIDWEEIAFDHSGPVERDIQLGGAIAEGVVIDGVTGTPLNVEGSFVVAIRTSPEVKGYSAYCDDAGRFRLRGLDAGTYNFQTNVTGFAQGRRNGVTIEHGQVLRDITIEVPASGKLSVELRGFVGVREDDLEIRLDNGEREQTYSVRYGDEEGKFALERGILAGAWLVTLACDGYAALERPVEIFHGATARIAIDRDELTAEVPEAVAADSGITVAGTFQQASGDPIAGASVYLFWGGGDDDNGTSADRQDYFHTTTDPQGCFTAEGLRPGQWRISARLANGGEPDFSSITIPAGTICTFPLRLVLPDGKIRGVFVDRLTASAFSSKSPRWWVFLLDSDSKKVVCDLNGGHTGSDFNLVGIPAGRYELLATARGYNDHESKPFYLAAGQTLDVGIVPMDPCGVLELVVVDALGQPIPSFAVHHQGQQISWQEQRFVAPGRLRCFKLPTGLVKLRIKAEGYRDKELNIELSAGRPEKVEIVLASEH